MRYVKTSFVKVALMTGIGALVTAAGGCATVPGGSTGAAMTPAQAAQVADQECAGIPAKERELGIMAYRDSIGGVRPLKEKTRVGKWEYSHDRGVEIAVRAQPGMSAPWLERVATCHIALATAGRSEATSNGTDPLLVPGATVRVDEADTGFIVSVRVPDDASDSEISRRTQALLSGPSGPATAEATSP
jgi:hypothetical protein